MSSNFLQLRHFRYFVGIVDAGGLSRAARTMHVAQPALSQSMTELEAELGVVLLQRSSRGTHPTREGETFYRYAVSILQQVDQVRDALRSMRGEPEGLVRLGMSSALPVSWSSAVIEACRTMLPNVQLRVVTADDLSMKLRIASRSLDLCVMFEGEPIQGFARQQVFQKPLYLVRPPVAEMSAPSVSLEALAELRFVLPIRPDAVRCALDRTFQEAGLILNCDTEVDTLASALCMVKDGVANTITPKGLISQSPGHEDLRLFIIDPPISVTASIISCGDTPLASEVSTVLAAQVKKCFGENELSLNFGDGAADQAAAVMC
ncbi:LysR family transcriptional regulator [Bradyrhizobium sp. CB3481]|uniref:LysR family transcriptional regulator n=1 Tax=Bradyrhizobium sp. CB3481 TaxID=3039158 RepID=UPI0024B2768D|nr:LysR family transcriptional regulator [Bradyrhizobium sp. CB3481]WFU14879.1 LysR family transcriptional regulator [Bradyrhizobium sp. CB3481]